jgi:hypothetical protein
VLCNALKELMSLRHTFKITN